jgi:hypothetical protein
MSVAQGIRLHPHHQAFASLRTHLLRSRRMLAHTSVRQICHRCRTGTMTSLCRDYAHNLMLDALFHMQAIV